MRPYSTFLGLPASLLVLVVSQAASSEAPPPAQARPPQLPTAIRKMGLDGGEKFFPEYMAFAVGAPDAVFEYAPTPLSPREAALAARLARRDADADANANGDPLPAGNASLPLRPAFATHGGLEEDQSSPLELLRRAAEALHLLQGRQSCPAGMGSCAAIGAPNKCCITGEYCVQVNDPSVGQVACCPQGRTCSGSVGPCGAGSTSCSADLGGGCCIPGYVCQGVGCVPSASATPTRTTTTTSTTQAPTSTTTMPSTTTTTTTPTTTASDTDAIPPFRPTMSTSSQPETTPAPTETACPTGYYACLARYDGGCCQIGRDCATTSCPATPLTTIVNTNGVTVVVPVTAVPAPDALPTKTCASGWYICGADAGPVAGCCPSGYTCGTASCTLLSATQTAEVQKALPSWASRTSVPAFVACIFGLASFVVGVLM